MIQVENLTEVKSFIQHQLGCGCPEEVFEDIEYTEIPAGEELPCKMQRLLVGQRLLIYIVQGAGADSIDTLLPLLIQRGREERDTNRYNRTRIVLAATEPSRIQPAAELLFSSLTADDEKLHLHIVPAHLVENVR